MRINEVVVSMVDYRRRKKKAAAPTSELGPPLCPRCGQEAQQSSLKTGPQWFCSPCKTVIR